VLLREGEVVASPRPSVLAPMFEPDPGATTRCGR
jgi:hypothetical protein